MRTTVEDSDCSGRVVIDPDTEKTLSRSGKNLAVCLFFAALTRLSYFHVIQKPRGIRFFPLVFRLLFTFPETDVTHQFLRSHVLLFDSFLLLFVCVSFLKDADLTDEDATFSEVSFSSSSSSSSL